MVESDRPTSAGSLLEYSGAIDLPLARMWMCTELRAQWVSEDVVSVMGAIPRHAFAPPDRWRVAYVDQDVWTGTTWMTSPGVVARVVDALPRTRRVRTLEIGTGTGYQTAVLAGMGRHVVSCDVSPHCVYGAYGRLRALCAARPQLLVANGLTSDILGEPFDAIVVNAALSVPPALLVRRLAAEGGVLVAPIVLADGSQRLVRYDVSPTSTSTVDLGSCRFEAIVEPTRRA